MRKELLEAASNLAYIMCETEYHQEMIKDLRKQIREHQKIIAKNKELLLEFENISKNAKRR